MEIEENSQKRTGNKRRGTKSASYLFHLKPLNKGRFAFDK